MEQRMEKRKHYLYCNIAGFMYWDGCEAFSEPEVGKKFFTEKNSFCIIKT